jgi:hypothetical protein
VTLLPGFAYEGGEKSLGEMRPMLRLIPFSVLLSTPKSNPGTLKMALLGKRAFSGEEEWMLPDFAASYC